MNHTPIIESLERMGAEVEKELIQRDYYFTPPQVRSFKKGSIIRIREEACEPDNKRQLVLSYKSPNVLNKGVETREEIEVELLSDVETISRLLDKIGIRPLVEVAKKRLEYNLTYEDTSFTITLDKVDGLGLFVEIELVSDQENDVYRITKLGEQLASRLNIDLSKKISLGYHELMLQSKIS